jgi:hypothetical protein
MNKVFHHSDVFEISPKDEYFTSHNIDDTRGMYIIGIEADKAIHYEIHVETMFNRIRTLNENQHNQVCTHSKDLVMFKYHHEEQISFTLNFDLETGSTAELWVSPEKNDEKNELESFPHTKKEATWSSFQSHSNRFTFLQQM